MTSAPVLTSSKLSGNSPVDKGPIQTVIFSSFQYFLFLPVVVFIYWRLSGYKRLLFVVAASYFFYMSWLPIYGVLLLLLSTASWLLGLLIDKYRDKSPSLARHLVTAGIAGNLLCLCYYKYTNFLLSNIFASLGCIGTHLNLVQLTTLKAPVMHIILPLGISFFVFEFIHYLVDVYKGSKSVRSWTEFSAFAAFFPSQIAGPIKRYQQFDENLCNPIPWSADLFYEGCTLIAQGLFKKVAIADPLGWVITPTFLATAPVSCLDVLIGAFGFTLQIFCDFSGYTDMGRGSALLLGIRLPINFQLPFLAEDINKFWQGWHISLSSWIRDYIYIPLGGSRCSHQRSILNIFITMSLCGLWHGATWQYVIWGSLHGLAMIVNREWKFFLEKTVVLKQVLGIAPMRVVNAAAVWIFLASTLILFRAPELKVFSNLFSSLANIFMESSALTLLIRSGVPVFAFVYLLFWLFTDLTKRRLNITLPSRLIYPLPVRFAAWTGTLLFLFAARPTQATPFIYFQF
jgi:alginate O-acetyltransferase complex protein AlgI